MVSHLIFGPLLRKNYTVKVLLNRIKKYIPKFKWKISKNKKKF